MEPKSDLPSVPEMPGQSGEPVFNEPWEASAFAIAVSLNQAGAFEWTEWVDVLSKEIKKAEASESGSGEGKYYLTWFAALEKLLVSKKMLEASAIDTKQKYLRDNPVPHDHNARREPIAVA